SGVAAIWYRIDGGGWTLFAGPFGLAEGRHQVDYYAVDQAGNVEPVNSVDVGIDTTTPTTSASLAGTAGENGWYVSDVTVTLTAFLNASDATSGIANITYRVDGGPWSVYAGPFVLADGVHVVEFFATDLAGITEPIRSLSIAIDTTPPVTEATLAGTLGQGGWYTSAVTFSVHASDPGSGIANVNCRVDGGTWT